MALLPRITAIVKAYLSARSGRLLDFLCKPYVRPQICRLKQNPMHGESQPEDKEQKYEPLRQDELDRLFAGTPIHSRLRLFADSGFGKSTLLVELEGTIASTPGPLVPIRIGAGFKDAPAGAKDLDRLPLLSDSLFHGDLKSVAAKLAEQLLSIAERSFRGEFLVDRGLAQGLAEAQGRTWRSCFPF